MRQLIDPENFCSALGVGGLQEALGRGEQVERFPELLMECYFRVKWKELMQCRILLRHIYGASSCFAAPPPPQLALHRNHIPCPNTKLLFNISVCNLCNSMQMMRKKDKLSSSSSSKGNAVINQDILNLTFATQRNTRDQKWKTKRKPK